MTAGNECCADGSTKPDCSLPVLQTGYWELDCPAPRGVACAGVHSEKVSIKTASPSLVATYTTGTFHVIPGRVTIALDGEIIGTSLASLPGGTVNSPVDLGPIAAGDHELELTFESTNGSIPGSWGGFLDLYEK